MGGTHSSLTVLNSRAFANVGVDWRTRGPVGVSTISVPAESAVENQRTVMAFVAGFWR